MATPGWHSNTAPATFGVEAVSGLAWDSLWHLSEESDVDLVLLSPAVTGTSVFGPGAPEASAPC
jgi:hypothetical protein